MTTRETKKEQRERVRAERLAREQEEQQRARRNRRLWQVGGSVALAVAIVIAAIAISSSGSSSGGSSKGKPAAAGEVQSLLGSIPQSGVTLGNPSAPVTVSEFADLQCPFCREYTLSIFPSIVAKYVQTGKVKMVWRNLTFIGPDSVTAAEAAAAAGEQNKLWSFVDVWYHNQGEENSGYVTDAFIRKVGTGVSGLDVGKLMSTRGDSTGQQQLSTAQSLSQQFHVNSTPTFLVQRGSAPPTTVGDMTQLSSAIDKALAGR